MKPAVVLFDLKRLIDTNNQILQYSNQNNTVYNKYCGYNEQLLKELQDEKYKNDIFIKNNKNKYCYYIIILINLIILISNFIFYSLIIKYYINL